MNKTAPSVKDRKKFDIDLEYGKIRESQILDMFENAKIEVKSERDIWQRSGNIAIEYECYGKPSGIKATESDYWFHNLCINDETYATLVFRTDFLRRIIDSLDYVRSVKGGDNMAARMYLLNIQRLFSSDVIKAVQNHGK
jgi:hypothetical protein|tara:strand:+ start:468 stop:887 length:420 start_codon:yes stop_codon:yes gene_type:complete